MNEDEEKASGTYAPIGLETADFGSLLSSLNAEDSIAKLYRRKFRLPRIVFPVIPVTQDGQAWQFESSTQRNLRVGLFTAGTQVQTQNVFQTFADGATAGRQSNLMSLFARNYRFDGSVWANMQTGSAKAVPASAASPITVFAAAGAGLKRRVFDIAISASPAGVVVLSDGLGSIRATTGPATCVHYGPDGILQDTANTAITATLAGSTLEAIGVGNAGE